VRERALAELALVAARGDDLAVEHDDGADGHVAMLGGAPCLAQRQAHVVLVAGEVQFAHAGIMPETGGKRNRGWAARRAGRTVSSAARV
jgi:hypothetical protein